MPAGRSNMDNNPFTPTSKVQDSGTARRRSTRIDYITTVLLSGKDASGTPFREFTQTATVNLHGCLVRTSYRILVGMIVTIECPKAGTSGKGVCVRVWDPAPGATGHEIAIQLIKPQNLWGVPNPPPDWEIVIKTMVQGRVVQGERMARYVPPPGTNPLAPPPPPRVPTPVAAPRPPVAPQPAAPPAFVPVQAPPIAAPNVEQRLAELEKRATQLVESVLDIMRGQAEELTRNSLEEFRQQVDVLISDAEGRLRQNLQQAYEESAASLIGLRTDLMEQISSRGAQMIRSTEDSLRTRLRNQLALDDKTAPAKPPQPVTEK